MKETLRGSVYSALLGETTWQSFLDRLAATVPDGKAALVVHDTSDNSGYALVGGGDFDRSIAHAYNTYYARLNPLQPRLAARAIGSGASDHELMPREELVETEFHNDFLVPRGMRYSAGVRFAGIGSQSFTLVSAGPKPEAIHASVGTLNHLAPHLKRAIGSYRSGPSTRTADALGASLLEAAHIGVIVINDQERIRLASRAAQAMLAERSPVLVSPGGRIRFRRADIQAACSRMLARDYRGPRTLDFIANRTRLTLVLVDADPASLYFEGPSVVAFLKRPGERPPRYDMQLLSDTYSLSKSETRALSGIVAGLSVTQIAAQASLSRETIRSQVKSLYAKTGAAGMADILRLAHRHYQV